MPLHRPLRYGMVGGGPDAFIGAVHRRAASLDGLATLAAGAFSSDPEKSRTQGRLLHLDPERVYGGFREMAEAEAALPKGERIDFVSIVTPNHLHHPMARAFLEAGIHVVCDKPLTTTVEDAEDLLTLARERDLILAVTYNYSGYPLVKEARAMVREGKLGTIRKVVAEYSQGWLATAIEAEGQKQAAWRTDPERAGAGALGDIGSHVEHLSRYVTGLEPERILGEVHTFVPGRQVDDDATLLVRYRGGARGVIACTQIAVGKENDLRIRVHGTEGSLEWCQEEPNELLIRPAEGPMVVHRPGHPHLSEAAQHATRLPPGHPEAFLEGFANVYGNIIRTISARLVGETPDPLDTDFPNAEDGLLGVRFIRAALEAGRTSEWVELTPTTPQNPGG
ncbi:MAG: Gfo/Idh/MocA family oxidoreductase [Gemmatimonadota bacterium]